MLERTLRSLVVPWLLLGVAACSSSPGTTSPGLTEAERTAALGGTLGLMTLDTLGLRAGASFAPTPPPATLRDVGGPPCMDMSAELCPVVGSARFCTSVLGDPYDGIDFEGCSNMYPGVGGSGMYMVLSGSVTSAGTTRTFGSGQYSYFNARMVTDHRDVTCGVTGSSTYRVIGENAVDTEYATTQRCGSTTFQSNGGLETRLVNSHVLVSGLSRQITTGPAGGSIVVCVYADFDVTTATCADFAAACDLPQSSCD